MASKTGRMAPCEKNETKKSVSLELSVRRRDGSKRSTNSRVPENVLDVVSEHHLVEDLSTRHSNEAAREKKRRKVSLGTKEWRAEARPFEISFERERGRRGGKRIPTCSPTRLETSSWPRAKDQGNEEGPGNLERELRD